MTVRRPEQVGASPALKHVKMHALSSTQADSPALRVVRPTALASCLIGGLAALASWSTLQAAQLQPVVAPAAGPVAAQVGGAPPTAPEAGRGSLGRRLLGPGKSDVKRGADVAPGAAGASNAPREALRVPPLFAAPLPSSSDPNQPPGLSLEEIVSLVRQDNPSVALARAQSAIAKAGVETALAYPNPELEFDLGRNRARLADVPNGSRWAIGVTQPVENPRLRESRLQTAQARVGAVDAELNAVTVDVAALVRQRFLMALQIKEQLRAVQDDLRLTEQIRDRVEVRFRTGESPRFDLIRAESEVAVAQKNLDTLTLRLSEALYQLRQVVGPNLPETFSIRGDIESSRLLSPEDLDRLKNLALVNNPESAVARANQQVAQQQLETEKASVMPGFGVRMQHGTEPEIRSVAVGAVVSVPLWNKREGPIAEAAAQSERARLAVLKQQFELKQNVESAIRRYQSASVQVKALENGIVDRARRSVEIAEAAYRLGERGILEFLDAQRQFRLVRNELIAARFELQFARIELERLAGRS